MKELIAIQGELKAPKSQFNSFGKYNYRSCEDILEAVKPLLKQYQCLLTITDDVVQVGDRIYVKATATIYTPSMSTGYSVSAFARESETKKGMDDSQVTGTASSYARKYALNGLFCIDDTKDADTMDNRPVTHQSEASPKLADDSQRKTLNAYIKKFMETNDIKAIDYISESLANPELTYEEAKKIISHAKLKVG